MSKKPDAEQELLKKMAEKIMEERKDLAKRIKGMIKQTPGKTKGQVVQDVPGDEFPGSPTRTRESDLMYPDKTDKKKGWFR